MCDNIIVIYCNASHKIGQLVFLSLLTATISYVRRPAIETKGTNGSRLILLDKIYMSVARAGSLYHGEKKSSPTVFVCNIGDL